MVFQNYDLIGTYSILTTSQGIIFVQPVVLMSNVKVGGWLRDSYNSAVPRC